MIKIKAKDSFNDSRVGMVHAGQVVEVSEKIAEDLKQRGFVVVLKAKEPEKTVKSAEEKAAAKQKKADQKLAEEKKLGAAPQNKMLTTKEDK